MDDFVAKPFKLEELAAVLHRWTPSGRDRPDRPDRRPGQESAGPIEPPTIDPAALDALAALHAEAEPDSVKEILGTFVQDTPSQIATIQAALALGDWPAAHQLAHALEGMSSQLGARRLAALCAAIQEQGEKGGLQGEPATLIAELETEFVRVRTALEARL